MESKIIQRYVIFGIIMFFGLVIGCMTGCPYYSVYQQKMEGEAELAKANYSKQVQVQEAKAKMESAQYNAAADTIRAKGVAISNRIIGLSLQHNEAYLHWLWIDQLEKNQNAVFYVPTENNMPLMLNSTQAKGTIKTDSTAKK